MLEKDGISAEVINIHTIKPIDEELVVASATKTKKVVTVEEHSVIGGLGSAVAEVLCEKAPTKMMRIGVNDRFGESGPAVELIHKYELDAEGIYKKVKAFAKTITSHVRSMNITYDLLSHTGSENVGLKVLISRITDVLLENNCLKETCSISTRVDGDDVIFRFNGGEKEEAEQPCMIMATTQNRSGKRNAAFTACTPIRKMSPA